MKKVLLALIIVFLTAGNVVAQSTMTDQQLVSFILEEKEKGTSQQQIVTMLIQRGVDITQIQRVKRRYERQIQQSGLGNVADEAISNAQQRMRTNNGQARRQTNTGSGDFQISQRRSGNQGTYDNDDPAFIQMQAELGSMLPVDSIALLEQLLAQQQSQQSRIFGHDIFTNDALSFEPNMNIPTPQDYRLGPGDAVAIEIYGASQESHDLTITPDGYVSIPDFGPVQLSGLTVAQANSRLRSQLGARYQSSQIRLSVGQTRTILVNVMGEVKLPGSYTLSAFSTVFNALYIAGGVNDIGTLRNIKVYRQNRLISTVDVYDFIINGRATGNVRLTDNDVIIVEPYECLVSATGKVKRSMYYEMKRDESLNALLQYAGGFTSDAYRRSVKVTRKDGALRSVHTVGEFDFNSFHLEDGDSVSVDSIQSRLANTVEVRGAVFHPDMYQLGGNVTSVKTLLEAAQGLTEDAITTRGIMHRMKDDRTLEVLSVDLAGIMDGSQPDVLLHNEDVLFVPSRKEILEMQTLTIHGEVLYPGVYKYAANETIEDFILQAGGLTDAASMVKVDVARRINNPYATESQDTLAMTFSFSLQNGFVINSDTTGIFHLEPFDEVYIRKSPGYSTQQNVYIEGEVLFEGTYTLSMKGERLSTIVERAGGLSNTAYAAGARLIRNRTSEEMARLESLRRAARMSGGRDSIDISRLDMGTTYSVGIQLDKALQHPGSDADIVLREGDRLIVPEYNGTVKINGEVMYPNTTGFVEGKSLSYYINQAGGYGSNAKKSQTYIIYMNGTVAKADRKHKPMPGCEIVVPTKQRGNRMSTAEMLTIGSTTASIATMIATLVNLFK